MGSNRTIAEYPQTGPTFHSTFPQKHKSDLGSELENRIENLNRLLHSVQGALEEEESFSNKPHVIDFVTDLRLKIKASDNMLRVAKLLSEPARESMLAKVRDSLEDLEQMFASHLGVKLS